MPKVGRTADPLVGEALACKHARLSCSSSSLEPQLSIHLSPQHEVEEGQESDQVTEVSSPRHSSVFPFLLPKVKSHSGLITPGSLSSESDASSHSSVEVKMRVGKRLNLPPKERGSPHDLASTSNTSLPDVMGRGTRSPNELSDECIMQRGSGILNEDSVLETAEDCYCGPDSAEECGDMDTENVQSIMDGGEQPQSSKEQNNSSENRDRQELTSLTNVTAAQPASSCGLAGLMTLTGGNGDPVLHSMLPSVISHNTHTTNPTVSSCLPGTDGNWYQIIPTGIPPLLSTNQHIVENAGGSVQASTMTTTSSSSSCDSAKLGQVAVDLSSHPCLSSLSSMTVSAAGPTAATTSSGLVTPIAAPGTNSDPLLSFLQHYTAVPACSPDLHNPLSALHLPLNLAAAAAAAGVPAQHTPHYVYATNPRTGQLLILSSVGDLSGAQALQQLQFQQQQFPLHQLLHGGKPNASPGLGLGSGKETENMPSVAAAQELLALAGPARAQGSSSQASTTVPPPPLLQSAENKTVSDEPVRENHNMKERRRRARIKDACDLMRQLVPGLSEKTDKATVFEFSARYIHFLKNFVGTHHDKDFLIKYSPY